MRLGECSFVVVDCETTGFHPSAHHRIVELALIPVDGDGRFGEAWCSLLNPDRDLGPTDVHGIRGRDLRGAPRFADVLGDVLEHLAGSVVVAHNATFDCAFLTAELARAGIEAADMPALCTMRLADLVGLGSGRLGLSDCCQALGIHYAATHAAMDDAQACAELFKGYLPQLCANGLDTLTTLGCPLPMPREAWPTSGQRKAPKHRSSGAGPPTEPTFVGMLAREAAGASGRVPIQVASYLEVLDRALEDRHLSSAEQDELAHVATMLGFVADEVRSIHADYLGTLIALAYRDGVVTERERADLDLIAEALGLDGIDEILEQLRSTRSSTTSTTNGQRSLAGRSVCFTGTLLCSRNGQPITREDAHALATNAGLVVASNVTKKLDVLVVADPDSLSGKAQKARTYGTRIIAESAFWPMIGIDVD